MKQTKCDGSVNLTLDQPFTVSGADTEEAAKAKAKKWILVYIYVNTGSKCPGSCDSDKNECEATLSLKDLEKAVEDVFAYFSDNEPRYGVTIPKTTFALKCRCVEKPKEQFLIRRDPQKKA
jgi:hypothetical protein